MSFKDLREFLLLSLEENMILDEEFVLLFEDYSSKNPEFEYSDYTRFDFDKLGDAECKANFRVEKRDLPALFIYFSNIYTGSLIRKVGLDRVLYIN